jgi:glycosyltransferase involved in cell wall biosynthesis
VKREKPSILVVSSPSPVTGGGGLRALRSMKEYVKHFETHLVIPWGLWDNRDTLRDSSTYLKKLKELGVKFTGFSQLPGMIYKLRSVSGSRTFDLLTPLLIPGIGSIHVSPGSYDAVVVLHEDWDAVYTGYKLTEYFNASSIVLLHNPPFYGSKERFLNIVKALLLWRELRSDSPVEEALFKAEVLIRELSMEYMRKHRYSEALGKYTLIVGVTKATSIEMGGEWINRIISLDPGVSLDHEDLSLMKRVRERVRSKENYVVFGGRPDTVKGLAEALIVFKQISKRSSGLKLVITGKMTEAMTTILRKVCRKLGILDKVLFTGFIPRTERFEVIAKARLMLYPSHEDTFSYAVLESLHLGTPVVGYKIPGLEIYYGGLPGVELVEEWDLEALTVEAMNILERGVDAVEPPKIKSWEEIMSEEVGLLYKLVESM